MKYCSKCGKQLFDEAVFCPGCGCPTGTPLYNNPYVQNAPKAESSGLATAAVVFAFLMPIVGLILGIIGGQKYTDLRLKQRSKSAIFLSLGMWIIYFVIIMVLVQL